VSGLSWDALASAAKGRFSLQVVVYASVLLLCLVTVLMAYILAYRAWMSLRQAYRRRRRQLYEPAVAMVLMEESPEAVLEAFKPRRWGDEEIVLEVMLDSMQHLSGPPFELMQKIAMRLGLVELCLKDLRARSSLRRGRAMEALGLLRAPQAIVALLDILKNEPMDLKLVALRALAQIGDPAVLPYFLDAAETLSPAMMVRLASLLLEFGPPGRAALATLFNRRPEAFPPRVMQLILQEAAQA
jgi:hypothetical protein